MGFGFVEFDTHDQANNAIETLQGKALDGHALQLKISDRETGESSGRTKDAQLGDNKKSTKLLVRNVPFEASKKEIMELFRYVLQGKSCLKHEAVH